MNAPFSLETISLDRLPRGTRGRVAAIAWEQLDTAEANRLRHFGFDTGISIEALHSGPFGRDPIAIRVGRMNVAIRRRQAQAVLVQPEAA